MIQPTLRIEVSPRYLPEQSQPDAHRYFFTYTITISNQGPGRCQLLSRHWIITDANGIEQEVIGEGVVGQQPEIAEGASFTYTSGVMLETPVGTMQGSYHLVDAGLTPFEAEIEPFLLAFPGSIN
jgi:ApaG protein